MRGTRPTGRESVALTTAKVAKEEMGDGDGRSPTYLFPPLPLHAIHPSTTATRANSQLN